MSLKLSAVTATYNRKEFLPRCIESVACQNHPTKEHVIVDGGSTDGTLDVIKHYAAKYRHIRWIPERDTGISDAFNKGLAMATGDALGIIGDDDYYKPEAFDRVATAFESDPRISLVSGHCDILRNDGSTLRTLRAAYTNREQLLQCWRYWGRGVMLPAPSTFIHKRVIARVGGFQLSDKYAMDYRHWLKITAEFPNVEIVDQVLACFRWDDGTVSYSLEKQQQRELISISKEYWGDRWSSMYRRMSSLYVIHHLYPSLKGDVRDTLARRRSTKWIVDLKKRLEHKIEASPDGQSMG